MQNKKVVFVNRYFFPDHSATSQMLTDLAFELSQKNHPIHIVTSRQAYDDPLRELPRFEKINGVTVHRLYTTRFGRAKLLGRALDYLTFHISVFWYLINNLNKNDIVVAKTDPPLISVVTAGAAQFRKAHLINWLQDIFPEVASALNIKGPKFLILLLKTFRDYSLRRAHTNVVLSGNMAKFLTDANISSKNLSIIHNWSDGNMITPITREQNPLRKEWCLENRLVVGYSGNMGRAHEFNTILDAAEKLRNHDDIVFLFIGGGAGRKLLEDEKQRRGLNNLIFKPYQSRDQLSISLSLPDIHLISLLPALEGLIVPSKFYGIAAAAKPTLYIGARDGSIPSILHENNCGITVDIGDSDGLVKQILNLLNDPVKREQMGTNARLAFDREFDKEMAIEKWENVIMAVDNMPYEKNLSKI